MQLMLPILEKASHEYKNFYAADITQSILLYLASHENRCKDLVQNVRSKIQWRIKKILKFYWIFLGMQGCLTFRNQWIWHIISIIIKLYDYIRRCRIDKIQYYSIKKRFSKLGINAMFLNIIKTTLAILDPTSWRKP